MNVSLACIVEGDGDVEAVPLLVRRIAAEAFDDVFVSVVQPPIRVPRSKLVKNNELERSVELAVRRVGKHGAVLVLIDSDNDCPARLGPTLLQRARSVRPGFAISVVLAKFEYEAWFIAAAESLRGRRGLADDLLSPPDSEAIRDAKGWLKDRMPVGRKYRETLDQPALTAVFDIQAARKSDSFDKCRREIIRLIETMRARLSADGLGPC